MENVKLTFTQDGLQAIAQKAVERKTGARGLRSIIEGILLDTMFEIPGQSGIEEVVINEDVVKNGSEPLVIYAKKSKDKAKAG